MISPQFNPEVCKYILKYYIYYYEHGNEPSGSIKGREFFDQLRTILASEEGLSAPMELVT
jgi:hypothetical protein